MATLETKYAGGDVVFHASTTTVRAQHPCPDCLGARKWKATSPAGGEYEFACPRCSARYRSDDTLSLDYTVVKPSVSRLTIGSVRYNSHSWHHGGSAPEIEYMCAETGVGSGTLYKESNLFSTEGEARIAAEAKAAADNKNIEWVAVRYNQTLDISDYQLESGALRLARDMKLKSGSMLYGLLDLFNAIEEAADKKAILEAIEEYRRYDWHRDKDKLAEFRAELLAAASDADSKYQLSKEWA